MRALFLLAICSLAGFSVLSASERVPVLLELFTSEGCSSCPPADHLLAELDREQPVAGADVIVASEHVDYWNREGWTDPFSSALFSRRQREYAAHLGVEDVYTPQLVIDGRTELVGSLKPEVLRAIAQAAETPKAAMAVTASRVNEEAQLHLTAAPAAKPRPAYLFVMLARNSATTKVSGGENKGRSLVHISVVQSVREVGLWKMQEGLDRKVTVKVSREIVDAGARVIVFARDAGNGRILAVAQAKL